MTCDLHRSIGHALAELGGILRCTVCRHEQTLVAETIAHHLAWGWPEHCGRVMRWVTDRELLEEHARGVRGRR